MRRLFPVLVMALLGLARPAAALDPGTADGSVTLGGKSIDLTTAYATHYFNDQGLADGPELRILLADRKIDVDLLAGPLVDPVERAARSGQIRGVLLRVDPERLGAAPVRGTLLIPVGSAPQDLEASAMPSRSRSASRSTASMSGLGSATMNSSPP